MKGKFVLISIIIFVMTAWTAGAQDSSPRVWLSSEIAEATAGQEFTVTVNVAGTNAVYGGSFQLTYDPTQVEVILAENLAVTPGAFFGAGPSFTLKNTAVDGVIDYALTLTQPATPISGDGALGTITFRALANAPVNITTVKADLVSPEFTEVEGRLIAQRINQVTAAIEPITAAGAVVQPAVSAPATASVSVGAATAAVNQPVQPAVTSVQPATEGRQNNNMVLLVAGIFFAAGLLLLTISVGMYSKMRTRFSPISDGVLENYV